MIIFKAVLTIALLISIVSIGVLLADLATGFRYEWLNNLAESIISVFLRTVLFGSIIGLIFICWLAIYGIWTL